MSFTRNPKKYDVVTKKPKIYKREIDAEISKIDDLLSSHRYYDRDTKEQINKHVEMVAYLLKHPKRTNLKPTTVNKIVKRVEKKVHGIKGINLQSIQTMKVDTVG